MRTSIRTLVILAVAGMALPALAADPCCYTNSRFTGTCSVTPGEGETCATILAYLNNPSSAGKSYCGGTTIRGGWTRADCDAASRTMCTAPSEPSQLTAKPDAAIEEKPTEP